MRARTMLLLGFGFLLTGFLIGVLSSKPEETKSPPHSATEVQVASTPVAPAPAIVEAEEEDRPQRTGPPTTQSKGPADTFLLAELGTVMDEPGFPPAGCEGWIMTAQIRNRETDEISHAQAACDENGIARFEFHGKTHVNWVRCIPPPDESWSIGFQEDHRDLSPGSTYETLLCLQSGHKAKGLVVDTLGQPVPDAVVHVFQDSREPRPEAWSPGFLTQRTNAQGEYRFDRMPPGFWVFAVEPGTWEMVQPTLGAQRKGAGAVGIHEATVVADAGTMHVVEVSSMEIRVLGSDGHSTIAMDLSMRPLAFDDGFLVPSGSPKNSTNPDRAPLRYKKPQINVQTDENGRAEMLLPKGRWQARVQSLPGSLAHEPELLLGEFHTNQKSVTFHLPSLFAPFRGVLLKTNGEPLQGHEVRLQNKVDGRIKSYWTLTTDQKGRFHHGLVSRMGSYSIWIPSGEDTLLNNWVVPPDWPGRELEFLVPAQEDLHVQFRDLDGNPHNHHFGIPRLISWDSSPNGMPDPNEAWWQFAKKRKYGTGRDGNLTLFDLQPGTYTIGLFSVHPVQESSKDGVPGFLTELSEIARFQVQTGLTEQEVRFSSTE